MPMREMKMYVLHEIIIEALKAVIIQQEHKFRNF